MSDRRKEERGDSSDRRGFPRPSLKLNLVILLLGIAVAVVAFVHREKLDARFATIISRSDDAPAELRKLREEIVQSGLEGKQLQDELESRKEYIRSLQSEQFYLSVDSSKSTMTLFLGNEPVRDIPITIGAPASLTEGKQTWTFAPLRGSFRVQRKLHGESWTPDPWVYLLKKQPVPTPAPNIANGLGEYIIELPNGYIIHSPPPPDSPLQGAKPGSFLAPANDLRAIWPRISEGTRVYVF